MVRIEQVLCPVDRSPASRLALEYAVALAQWYQARVEVLEVAPLVHSPLTELPNPPVPTLAPERHKELADELRRFVEPFSDRGIAIDTRLIEADIVGAILETARQMPADLIVLGTHGRSGLQRLTLGSVTEKVIRRTTCPVLTVPPHARGMADRHATGTVLCATDFSPASLSALELALSLAQEADASLLIMHVLEWPDGWAERLPEMRKDWERVATDRMQALIPVGAADWCEPVPIITSGKAAAAITDTAESRGADIIVLGAHGHSAIEVALFGSTTHRVIRDAQCPVLTVRGR